MCVKFHYSFVVRKLNTTHTGAAITSWKSAAYNHYNVTLERELHDDGSPRYLHYIFTCKTNPDDHPLHTRRREKTSEGTSNLKLGAERCDTKHGTRPTIAAQDNGSIPYSAAAHRAIIMLRCSKNSRPFNSVLDEDYRIEVQMLRPGTEIPHPITISRDARAVYLELSKCVRNYFTVGIGLIVSFVCTYLFNSRKRRNNTVHLVMDGWTSPIVASFLGIVVVWYEAGEIHQAILEFIRSVVRQFN